MPFLFRPQTELEQLQTAADELDASGYDRKRLRYVLLTHAHWDHVSGVPDFPGVPVLVTAAERRFIDEGGRVTVTAQIVDRSLLRDYAFEGGPYLGSERKLKLVNDYFIALDTMTLACSECTEPRRCSAEEKVMLGTGATRGGS
jgi:glyoxylase-like metal-dependent hydrolase (beta-lactamase superfamily II)